MSSPSFLLLHPPGWDACVSGPYAAGPYLQGFIRRAGFGCRWVDLNLALVNQFAAGISGAEVLEADSAGLRACNELYFDRQADLERTAVSFGGDWTLKEAYQPHGLDPGSSESVRRHLDDPAPYDAWLMQILDQLLAEETPTFVGLTLSIPQQIFGAFRTAQLVRRLRPDIPILFGGNLPTRLAAEMAQSWVFDQVDILALFQGEQTCVMLLQAGRERSGWSGVPNIRYREDGEIRSTGKRLLEPGAFAPPDFTGVAFEDYWGFPYATLMGARGCYYGKCPFCAIPYVWGDSGFRGHEDPAQVFESLRICVDLHGISRFKFVEESMYAPAVDHLAAQILRDGLDVTWEGYARMDKPWFDRAFLARASKAGLRKVYVGIEVVDGATRQSLGKKDRPAAEEFLIGLNEAGILAHVFVLVGHPGTGLDEAARTIEFALRNDHLIDTLEVSGFRYEKHTRIQGVRRLPDPARDWSLDDPYDSDLSPTLTAAAVDRVEREFFEAVSIAIPTWTHPIHHMASPWGVGAAIQRALAPSL